MNRSRDIRYQKPHRTRGGRSLPFCGHWTNLNLKHKSSLRGEHQKGGERRCCSSPPHPYSTQPKASLRATVAKSVQQTQWAPASDGTLGHPHSWPPALLRWPNRGRTCHRPAPQRYHGVISVGEWPGGVPAGSDGADTLGLCVPGPPRSENSTL